MTVEIGNTTLTNTFDYWRNRTNELADAMSTKAVTVESNTAVGNAAISGTFTANAFSGNGALLTSVNAASVGGSSVTDLNNYATSAADISADTAYTNAVSFATTRAATAYSNAVSVAATDATNKAANAYSNAVSTAATDATNKAANAYTNSVSYFDSNVNTAIDARVTKSFVDALNVDANTLNGQLGSYYLDWTNTTNKPDPNITITLTGDVTGSGNTTLTDLANGNISIATSYLSRGIAKAWVNFNGAGTIATRDSENVSSLTDNGTGDYTVNFSSSFGNINYAVSGQASDSINNYSGASVFASTFGVVNVQVAGSVRIATIYTYDPSPRDAAQTSFCVNGDLA